MSLETIRASDRKSTYRRSRLRRSWTIEWSWAEVVPALVGGLIAWFLGGVNDVWAEVWKPFVGGLVGILVWHFILRPVGRYVWVVPIQRHLETMELVDAARTERDDALGKIRAAEARNILVRDRQAVLDRLADGLRFASAYLGMVQKNPSYYERSDIKAWRQGIYNYLHDHVSREDALEFMNGGAIQIGPSQMWTPPGHRDAGHRMRLQMETLESIGKRIREL